MFDWFRRRQSGRNDTRSGGSILWKPSVSQEVDADLSFHLDMLVREFQDSGMDREAAEARARARFGDYHQASQACRAIAQGRERDRRRSDWHRGIRQDFLVAWRQIRRRPGLVVLALIMIALGVGATSGIFTVVNGVLLTPLPYPEPHRLVMVCEANEARASCGTLSPPNALDLAKASQTVSRIGLARSWTVAMEIEGKSQGIGGGLATPDFFQVMETAPALGRLFQPEDQAGVGSAVAIVSHLFWRTAFGGDSTIVGGSVAIDGVPTIIVGVLPEGFEAPFLGGIELWRPLHIDPAAEEHRDWRGFKAFGRLAPGATVQQAAEELSTIGGELARRHPDVNKGWVVHVDPLRDRIIGSTESMLLLFLAAVGFVLLIACANVANLLLARAADRQREMTVRAALGAGRRRLARLVLTESLVLALVGGVGGFLVGLWATEVFLRLAPPGIPRLDEVGLDLTVFAFALILTLGTSLFFGLIPAYQASRVDVNEALKASAPTAGGGLGKSAGRVRSMLVVTEMALATMLLISAGLLARSFSNLLSWDPGFEREHVLTLWTFVSPGVYPDRDLLPGLYQRAVDEVAALPGMRSVATASAGPLFGGRESSEIIIERRPSPPGQRPTVRWYDVSPGYFNTMGIPLVRGRDLALTDHRGGPLVAVVNETAARQLFSGENPLGERIHMPLHEMSLEIVGVVADVQPIDPDSAAGPEVYWSFAQIPRWASFIVMRTTGDPGAQARAVMDRLLTVAPTMEISRVRPMPVLVDEKLVRPRFNLLLLGVFAGVALLLAAGGVYGVLAFAVARRTRELGIRLALGANRRRVIGMVVRQGVGPALAGAVVGVAGALVLGRLLGSMLHGVTPNDPATIAIVTASLLVVAVLASWIPARRATRIDPSSALRAE
jgi:putative ABC transport system permease protein